MTLKDDILSDVDAEILNEDDFAESITHWPLGAEANAAPVVAVVNWDETEKIANKGKKFCSKASLYLSSSNSLDSKDVWIINAISYQTLTVSPPEGGLVVVEIKYVDKHYRTLNVKGLN